MISYDKPTETAEEHDKIFLSEEHLIGYLEHEVEMLMRESFQMPVIKHHSERLLLPSFQKSVASSLLPSLTQDVASSD